MFTREGVIIIDKEKMLTRKNLWKTLSKRVPPIFSQTAMCSEVRTEPNDMGAVRDDSWRPRVIKYLTAEVDYIPSTYTKLESEEDISNMGKMLEMFEDNDDVQNVFHNWENEDDYEG